MWFCLIPKSILSERVLTRTEYNVFSERIYQEIAILGADRTIALDDFCGRQRRMGEGKTDEATVAITL